MTRMVRLWTSCHLTAARINIGAASHQSSEIRRGLRIRMKCLKGAPLDDVTVVNTNPEPIATSAPGRAPDDPEFRSKAL
jgi:hypothetical protein